MKQKDVLKKVWKYLEHYRMLPLFHCGCCADPICTDPGRTCH